jgi:hypothetical protein
LLWYRLRVRRNSPDAELIETVVQGVSGQIAGHQVCRCGAVASGCPIDQIRSRWLSPVLDEERSKICHQVRSGKVFLRPPASVKHDVVIVNGMTV